MFIPQGQVPDAVNALNMRLSTVSWVIRTKVPPMSLSTAAQEQLRLATGLPVSDIRSMAQVVSRSTSREQFNSMLMTVFAICALSLAAIGIYGVMAYAVQQRSREIGVRLALGAEPGGVRLMVVLQGLRLALIGVALGILAAFALSRYMSSLLFGVEPRDPLVFVGVPLLLALIALLAVWVPAGRASRIDPLDALRAT
jgi:ABC-type antimicrobial peptide transport system permease subunit